MELQTIYQCDCNPGKIYSSRQSFQKHVTSKRHQIFTQTKNRTDLYKRLQDIEVELLKKSRECDIWKHKYLDLELQHEKAQDESESRFYDCCA